MTCTYNGWRNYETWVTGLWLGNDEGTYSYWREAARGALRDAEATALLTRGQAARSELARRLRDEIDGDAPDLGCGLYSDLLNAALSEVDWHEVAEHFLDDITPDEPGAAE